MADNLFHCMKCNKNRRAKTMRAVVMPGDALSRGVSMDYYRAKCPVCGSTMMKIRAIAKTTKKYHR